MTLVADAIHPSTVSWRYRTGTVLREEYASAVTPVTLVEADGFETVFESQDGNSAYALAEGVLWTVAMVAPGWHLPQDDLVDWLRGDKVSGGVTSELEALLARSPLCRAPMPYAPGKQGAQCRGVSAALPDNAVVVEGDVEGAGRAVQAWLDRNVRTCGGSVLVRSPGPHVAFVDGEPRILHRPRSRSPWDVAVRADRAEAYWDWRASRGMVAGPMPAASPDFPALTRVAAMADQRDADALQANAEISWASSLLARRVGELDPLSARRRRRSSVASDRHGLLSPLAGIMPYADPARLGLVEAEDAPDAMRACAVALRALLAAEEALAEVRKAAPKTESWNWFMVPEDKGPDMVRLAGFRLAYVEEIVLPRLSGVQSLDGDDMDALGGMAP